MTVTHVRLVLLATLAGWAVFVTQVMVR